MGTDLSLTEKVAVKTTFVRGAYFSDERRLRFKRERRRLALSITLHNSSGFEFKHD